MSDRLEIVVMKFGGTSVGGPDAISQLVRIVARETQSGRLPVVVVSAMSNVTDALFAAAAEAERGNGTHVAAVLSQLAARHRETARAILRENADEVVDALNAYLDDTRTVLSAIEILREASPRSLDAVAATGELMSSWMVAAALQQAGLRAAFLDARQILVTDQQYGRATPLMEDTERALNQRLAPLFEQSVVPVLGGYIGATREGVTTTLGRGGSDYSAAIFASGIGAAEVQIWTDVDGVLTGDPRIVEAPMLVPRLSFDEASELAYFGAKVLHPSTILPAMRRNIPVRILNSRHPEKAGTQITREAGTHRRLAAIACKRGITVLDITSTRMLMAHGFLRRVFEVFEHHRTAVDVVTTSEVAVSVTVDDDRWVEGIAADLREFADVRLARNMAILCAVGDALQSDSRLGSRIVAALQAYPLGMVSQSASRRNLTVVISNDQLPAAMMHLHAEFFAEVAA